MLIYFGIYKIFYIHYHIRFRWIHYYNIYMYGIYGINYLVHTSSIYIFALSIIFSLVNYQGSVVSKAFSLNGV